MNFEIEMLRLTKVMDPKKHDVLMGNKFYLR
jgi:hypothetical protein